MHSYSKISTNPKLVVTGSGSSEKKSKEQKSIASLADTQIATEKDKLKILREELKTTQSALVVSKGELWKGQLAQAALREEVRKAQSAAEASHERLNSREKELSEVQIKNRQLADRQHALESELKKSEEALKKQEQELKRQAETNKALREQLLSKVHALSDSAGPLTFSSLSQEQFKQLKLKFEASLLSTVTLPTGLRFVQHLPSKDNMIIGATDKTVEGWLICRTPEEKKEKETDDAAVDKPKETTKELKTAQIWKKEISGVTSLEIHPNGHVVVIDANKQIHVLQAESSIKWSDVILGYADSFVFHKELLIFWEKTTVDSTYFINVWSLQKDSEPELVLKKTKLLPNFRIEDKQHIFTASDGENIGTYNPWVFITEAKPAPICEVNNISKDLYYLYIGNDFFIHLQKPSSPTPYRTGGVLTNAMTKEEFEFPFDMRMTRIVQAFALNDRQSFLFAIRRIDSDASQLYFYSLITQVVYPLDIKGVMESIRYLQNGTQFSLCVKIDAATKSFQTFECEHLKKLSKELAAFAKDHVNRDPGGVVGDYVALDVGARDKNMYSFVHQLTKENELRLARASDPGSTQREFKKS